MVRSFFKNQKEEWVQKIAWRLVRSAEDRIGGGRGDEKRGWCVDRLAEIFPKEGRGSLEDYIRAAFVNFKAEQKSVAF